MPISSSFHPRQLLDDQPMRISTRAEKIFSRIACRIPKPALDNAASTSNEEMDMCVFENPLASLFGKAAEGMEQRERDNIDAMRALRRTLIALAAFAMLVAVLDVTSRDPQAIADRASSVIAVR